MPEYKRYRVITAEYGCHDKFEERLNLAADDGYELKFVATATDGSEEGFSADVWAIMEHSTQGIQWQTYSQ